MHVIEKTRYHRFIQFVWNMLPSSFSFPANQPPISPRSTHNIIGLSQARQFRCEICKGSFLEILNSPVTPRWFSPSLETESRDIRIFPSILKTLFIPPGIMQLQKVQKTGLGVPRGGQVGLGSHALVFTMESTARPSAGTNDVSHEGTKTQRKEKIKDRCGDSLSVSPWEVI